MRIISANLNQRLGNGMARARFESWLLVQAPDLLLAQEPFKPVNQTRPDYHRLPVNQHDPADFVLAR